MGKLINTTAITIDGLADVGEWYIAEGGHDAAARQQFVDAAGMVMGRPTYEGLMGFWTTQTGTWADMLNPLPKFVASRQPGGVLEWNATFIDGDPADGITRLKDEKAGDLLLIGCGELANYLLDKGVIDEVRFWVHPAIWGEGTRPHKGAKVRMRALGSTTHEPGVTLMRYSVEY